MHAKIPVSKLSFYRERFPQGQAQAGAVTRRDQVLLAVLKIQREIINCLAMLAQVIYLSKPPQRMQEKVKYYSPACSYSILFPGGKQEKKLLLDAYLKSRGGGRWAHG
jgi:hypothetical protein